MSAQSTFKSPGFVRAFIVPALWIFVVPVLGGAFFWHARSRFDNEFRTAIAQGIDQDAALSPDERNEARSNINNLTIARFLSDPQLQQHIPSETKTAYRTFQWMILISFGSIALAVLSFIAISACVLLSLRSQAIQYYALLLGWQWIKLAGVLQTIAQGTLLVALSYWVTALWFQKYSPKLVIVVGFIAIAAVVMLIVAFFKRVKLDTDVDGVPIAENHAIHLWERLKAICTSLGTAPPQHLIAGIEDAFFVTEQPVQVCGKTVNGRSLFVSLPLLKILNGSEADAVLAHEMAHFSGKDTLYSRKIAPLLIKYDNHLRVLYENPAARPVFHWVNCFRALFELSLGKHSRERELRADSIAAQQTSAHDLGAALLKITCYSMYRAKVQDDLFRQQQSIEVANVGPQIETGYHSFAEQFVQKSEMTEAQTSHPFDSHPPLATRLDKLGIKLTATDEIKLLIRPGDGKWFHQIDHSAELEAAQWSDFEAEFRAAHEQSLPFRYLPSNDQEREVVVAAFPEVQFTEKKGTLTIDFEKMSHTGWEEPIFFRALVSSSIAEGTIYLKYTASAGQSKKQSIGTSKFGASAGNVIEAFQRYYFRHSSAVEFQKYLASLPAD
jgi:Zn-dependent protease with chaperone function